MGLDVPQVQLLDHAAFDGVPGHDTAQNFARCGDAVPVTFGQLVDVLQKHGPLRQQACARGGRVVLRPFQAGVADVKCQKGHVPELSIGLYSRPASATGGFAVERHSILPPG